jgi:hypothetical protein
MFDNIKCEYKLLDLPQEIIDNWGGVKNIIFQTKDTPNQYMCLYKIDHEGVLWEEKTESEWIESETPDAESIFDRLGHMKIISRAWIKPNFSGSINFYEHYHHKNYKTTRLSFDNEDWQRYEVGWIEYKALFNNDLLISMDLVESTEPIELTDEELYNKMQRQRRKQKQNEKKLNKNDDTK